MAQVINTNVASLIAQNNLSQSQNALQTAIQRLSSGKRINTAADNAAGYAISQQFTAQINGLNQAAQNANDGISLTQTANGALNSINNSLQTIRQLAVQSRNATNSSADRQALNQEVQQQLNQINSVASQTQFNGQNILDGSVGSLTFQVGANAGQTISVNGANVSTSNLGANLISGGAIITKATAAASYSPGSFTSAISGLAGGIKVSGTNISTTGVSSVQDVISKINAQSGTTGVTASRESSVKATLAFGTSATAGDIYVNGQKITFASAPAGASDVVSAINNANVGVQASTGTGGSIILKSSSSISVYDGAGVFKDQASFGGTSATPNKGAVFNAGITLSSSVTGTAKVAAGTGASGTLTISNLGLNTAGYSSGGTISAATSAQHKLSGLNVSTTTGADTAMTITSLVLQKVSSVAATFGAVQNRLQSTITNLQTSSQNLSAARSRIQDTNFAQTTANLTRAQILQQAGTAMVAQANKLPNTVLQLLQ